MKNEQWDIYTASGEPTGETVTRGIGVLRDGQYHQVVHIWLIDDKGRVLIQQRSADLSILPGKWAVTGGSAVAGEDIYTAAVRELSEEIGIRVTKDELTELCRYRGRNDFVTVFCVHKAVSLRDVTMQEDEVQAVKWATEKELRRMVAERKFHAYSYLEELYKEIGKRKVI